MSEQSDQRFIERFSQWLSQSKTALSTIPAAFQVVRAADSGGMWALSISTVVNAAMPAAQAYAAGQIIDSVTQGIALGNIWAGFELSLPWLILEFGLITISAVIGQVRVLAEHILNTRLKHYIAMRVMQKADELDVQFFEDAAFYDQLQNARRQSEFRAMALVNGVFAVIQQSISLMSFLVIVVAFQPWIAVILFGASIPAFIAQSFYSRLFFRLLTRSAPEFRQIRYLEELMTTDKSIKEVRLFGLGTPIIQRHDDTFSQYYNEDVHLARKRSFLSMWWGFVSTASFYVAYAWVIWLTISGSITLGGLTFYMAILRQSQNTFQTLFNSINWLFENGLFMTQLVDFFNLKPIMPQTTDAKPMPEPMRDGIVFHNVSFRYPEREEWTLRHINLHIKAGETLALVGINGAGKTTLVKLLTRLYDPTEGSITIDGIDIREIDMADLHRHIGVIFQDFVRYQMSLNDNIGFGNVARINDRTRIEQAADQGGAAEIATTLSHGYDTTLGRQFQQGRELSGGQWQKIALSRAFMRDGGILILDEPTSALDAQYEYEVFQRFRELTQGRTAILISHRFSTVRMADRIAVISGGELVELGTHAELMANNGDYARLFEMQASGYR
jgi:ATP-binding cassette, subfamily B, bacterial